MILVEEIIDFIEKEFRESNLNSDSNIFDAVKIDGDDCEELLVIYSENILLI